jgi:hypothetical protein
MCIHLPCLVPYFTRARVLASKPIFVTLPSQRTEKRADLLGQLLRGF